jgi:hypothetical protein
MKVKSKGECSLGKYRQTQREKGNIVLLSTSQRLRLLFQTATTSLFTNPHRAQREMRTNCVSHYQFNTTCN